jgi:hypothetical protein
MKVKIVHLFLASILGNIVEVHTIRGVQGSEGFTVWRAHRKTRQDVTIRAVKVKAVDLARKAGAICRQ